MKKQCQENKYEIKKIIRISVIAVVVLNLIIGAIYFHTHYAVIDNKIYKDDVKKLHILSLDAIEINEINKCTEIETMYLSRAHENSISKFINFNNLSDLLIMRSDISSSDCEKLSKLNRLEFLVIANYTTVDFKGFNNNTVSSIQLNLSNAENLESLAKCDSLEWLGVVESTVSDNCIVLEDEKYIMKDSSVFASLDNLTFLAVAVDKIEDISGILEMDSLNEFCVYKGTISETDIRLLEDKGISIIYDEYNK